jgi:glycosyltransferase involved in cell wall biosynthesis
MYRRVAQDGRVDLCVVYASRSGLAPYRDRDFGVEVAWDSDLTSGYEHRFLPDASSQYMPGFFHLLGRGIDSELSKLDPDVVFVFGYTPAVMARSVAFALRRRRGIVMMMDSELLQDRPLWKRAAKATALPALFRAVDAFMTIGDNNEAYLRSYGVSSSKMVRGGYPTDEGAFLEARARRAELREQQRARWNLGSDEFVALFVGKLIPRKRPLDLARAVHRLRDQTGRRVVAVFAGDGLLRPELEGIARGSEDCIRLVGLVNQRQLPDVYAAADLLVHPAERDPHPLTLTESMLVGLPVLVSDRVGAVGPTDTARDGLNAWVVPVGDVDALEGALRCLAADPARIEAMASSTARVAAETGMDACVRGFIGAVVRAAREKDRGD